MDYLTFCLKFNYNQRDDMARESYQAFISFFNLITSKENNIKLLGFLGLRGYVKH
jgi:hypothetical protein